MMSIQVVLSCVISRVLMGLDLTTEGREDTEGICHRGHRDHRGDLPPRPPRTARAFYENSHKRGKVFSLKRSRGAGYAVGKARWRLG